MVRKTFLLCLAFVLTLSSITTNAWWSEVLIEAEADSQRNVTLIVELEGGGVLERTTAGSSVSEYSLAAQQPIYG